MAVLSRRNLTVAAAFFVSLLAAVPALARSPAMAQRYGGQEDTGQEIARLTNHDRMRHGLAPLEWNAGLERSAEAHLQWACEVCARAAQTPEVPQPFFIRTAKLMYHPVLYATKGLGALFAVAEDDEDVD